MQKGQRNPDSLEFDEGREGEGRTKDTARQGSRTSFVGSCLTALLWILRGEERLTYEIVSDSGWYISWQWKGMSAEIQQRMILGYEGNSRPGEYNIGRKGITRTLTGDKCHF